MNKVYQDTNTNAEQKINNWIAVWSLFFGGFYFMFKGMWVWVLAYFLIMLSLNYEPIAQVIAAVLFAICAPRLVEEHYIKKGWKLKDGV